MVFAGGFGAGLGALLGAGAGAGPGLGAALGGSPFDPPSQVVHVPGAHTHVSHGAQLAHVAQGLFRLMRNISWIRSRSPRLCGFDEQLQLPHESQGSGVHEAQTGLEQWCLSEKWIPRCFFVRMHAGSHALVWAQSTHSAHERRLPHEEQQAHEAHAQG